MCYYERFGVCELSCADVSPSEEASKAYQSTKGWRFNLRLWRAFICNSEKMGETLMEMCSLVPDPVRRPASTIHKTMASVYN